MPHRPHEMALAYKVAFNSNTINQHLCMYVYMYVCMYVWKDVFYIVLYTEKSENATLLLLVKIAEKGFLFRFLFC